MAVLNWFWIPFLLWVSPVSCEGSVAAEVPRHPHALDVVFENKSGRKVNLYWDDGGDGVFQGDLAAPGQVLINTFVGHKFFFTPQSDCTQRLYEVQMQQYIDQIVLLKPSQMALRDEAFERERLDWTRDYFERTGRTWRNYYPRDSVSHFMYNITHIGQTIPVTSNNLHTIVCPDSVVTAEISELLTRLQDEEVTRREVELQSNENSRFKPLWVWTDTDTFEIWKFNQTYYCKPKVLETADISQCEADVTDDTLCESSNHSPLQLEIEVLCASGPRLVRIKNFLSDAECADIISTGNVEGLKRSTVSEAALESLDRTSSTVWIDRDLSKIVDNVVRRIADVVGIDESLLYMNASSESLQLVHYEEGQLYKAHHDYDIDSPNNRWVTFLIYLNDPQFGGGHTSFPDADEACRDENDYFGLHPGKGNALFFYDLFPDGNTDPKSLHFAEPPVNGSQKWMSNLWIWDKHFGRS